MLFRSTILRAAHATARSRMASNRAWRSYRQAFADALRMEWRRAKDAGAQASAAADDAVVDTLPPAVAARVASIRTLASYEPHTSVGHARFRALHAEADEVANWWGRLNKPAKGAHHVAL